MANMNSRGAEMVAIITVLVGLGLFTVIMRVVARMKRHVPFGIDDYLCFFSAVTLISMLIELVLWCTIGGNGQHQADLDVPTMMNFGKIFVANQFSYFFICPAIKISIVCFYRRVFSSSPTFRRVSFGLNTLVATWGLGIIIACALQCIPLKASWDQTVDGKCFNQNTFLITNQVFNVVVDFVILALPIPMIWNLQRAWQDKLALNAVFALGIFVCFASIYRIVVLFWIDPTDMTYTVYGATLWTHIEPCIGLICSCLPIIRGLFPRLKMPGSGRKYATAPYYVGTDASTSHFATSTGPRSPIVDSYIKMEEALASRPDSGRGDVSSFAAETKAANGGIAVRTEIDVTQDAASMKSATR